MNKWLGTYRQTGRHYRRIPRQFSRYVRVPLGPPRQKSVSRRRIALSVFCSTPLPQTGGWVRPLKRKRGGECGVGLSRYCGNRETTSDCSDVDVSLTGRHRRRRRRARRVSRDRQTGRTGRSLSNSVPGPLCQRQARSTPAAHVAAEAAFWNPFHASARRMNERHSKTDEWRRSRPYSSMAQSNSVFVQLAYTSGHYSRLGSPEASKVRRFRTAEGFFLHPGCPSCRPTDAGKPTKGVCFLTQIRKICV